MAQSATTVTPENPTPPTNQHFVGAQPPLDPAQAAVDDGTWLNEILFAAKTAAAGSGTSVEHEGRGAETSVTVSYPANQPTSLIMTGAGAAYTTSPNADHASSLSPPGIPTLASFTAGSSASGVGTTNLTCTGTNFSPQSVVYVNGVAQTTVFASRTSLTCATVTKKTSAGAWPITVITPGLTTAALTWTFT